MELFLNSNLRNKYRIIFIKTNLRRSNKNTGRFDVSLFLSFFLLFTRLTYALIRHRPRVAYYPVTATATGWMGRDALCLIICRLFRARTIIHMRGSHLNVNFQSFHPLAQRLVRFTCKGVFLGIVQGECLRNQFDNLLPSNRVRVLYQAIDTRLSDNPDLPNVERNVFYNHFTGERLLPEDPAQLEADILAGRHAKTYKYLGIVSGTEKLAVMRASAVFALPSYSEGFSRALLEAMSLGLPVTCTPVGAHGEVVLDSVNGYLVDPGDVATLTQRIIALLQDDVLRQKMGRANSEYVRRTFDIGTIANELSVFIDQALTDAV